MNFPSDDGVAELCGGIWGLGIFDNGDAARIEAAKTFIKFMGEENAVNAVKASGFSSPRLSMTDVYAGAENIDDIKLYESFLPNMGDYYNVMTGWTEARTAWAEALQSISTGTAPADALASFTTYANGLLG
jgi:multiple sugar transport system substrate-binding protein